MKPPFFSVIIPTYNRAEVLPNAIASILKQEHQLWELIIIDDGSTDATREVISGYKDSRIKYYYQSRQERSKARNFGISKATGNFVCFLDSDDLFYQNHLKELAQKIEITDNAKGLYHTQILKKTSLNTGVEDWFTGLDNRQVVKNLLKGKSLFMNGICVSGEILKQNKFPGKFSYWEDQHLWIRILAQYPFFSVEEVTSQWNVGEGNSTSNIFEDKSVKNLDKYLGCIQDAQKNEIVKNTDWIKQKEFNKLKLKKALDFIYQNKKLNWLAFKQYLVCLKYLPFMEVSKVFINNRK